MSFWFTGAAAVLLAAGGILCLKMKKQMRLYGALMLIAAFVMLIYSVYGAFFA